MTLLKRVFSLSLFSLFLFTACDKKEYYLQFDLKEGDRFSKNLVLKLDAGFGGVKTLADATLSMRVDYSVVDVADDRMFLEMRFDNASLLADIAGVGRFGAGRDVPADVVGPSADVELFLSAIMNVPVGIVVDRKGTVVAIEGVDSIVSIVEAAAVRQSQGAEVLRFIGAWFDEQGVEWVIRSSVGSYFPPEAVRVGERWSRNERLPQLPLTNMESSCCLTRVRGNVAFIETEGKLVSSYHVDGREYQGLFSLSDFRGSSKGFVEMDIATGWVRKSSARRELEVRAESNGFRLPVKVRLESEFY